MVSCFSNSKFIPRVDEQHGVVHCQGVRVGGWRCESMLGRRLGRDRFALLTHQVYKLVGEEPDPLPAKKRRLGEEPDLLPVKKRRPAKAMGRMSYQMQNILSLVVRTGGLVVRPGGSASPRCAMRVAYCKDTKRLVMVEEQPSTAVVRMADNAYFKGMEAAMLATLPLSELLDKLSAICVSIEEANTYHYLYAGEVAYFMQHGCAAPVMKKA